LITDDLFAYQQSLNDWDKRRKANDIIIASYNKMVGAYKTFVFAFNDAQKEFYAEDDLRSSTQGNAVRGRLINGMIPPLADAQITEKYTAYVNAFEAARVFYFDNILELKKPNLLSPPP